MAALADELAEPTELEPSAPADEPEPEPAATSTAKPRRLSVAKDSPEFIDAVGNLRILGKRRKRLERELEQVEAALFAAIRAAHAVEVPKLTIAKDAGVSRQTVYNVLGREEA